MPALADLARTYTDIPPSAVEHLERLVASWGLIADLCFSDLLLFAPLTGEQRKFAVLGQVRASTGQTLYPEDMVGRIVAAEERPLVARAWEMGEPQEGEPSLADGVRISVHAAPVRTAGHLVAVLTRESLPSTGRRPSPLERTYMETAQGFIRMVATGAYPFAGAEGMPELPRVGDGVIRVDGKGKITYTSPNAVSALHRLGVVPLEGMTLAEVGLDDYAVRNALTMVAPVTTELERDDTVVVAGVIPLIESRIPVGALVLLRDVSELRRKERLLLSKDATIREIHHRVKNNLQTIASLLRLQGRRLRSAEAKLALEESVRRIRSIALVHETLSRDVGEVVAFRQIVRPLVSTVEEGLTDPESQTEFVVEGDPGDLPAQVATPLAVVLTELLQNAVEHGTPDDAPRRRPTVRVIMKRDESQLRVEVRDNGPGLPPGFDLERDAGLGLQIVRALVDSELSGRLFVESDDGAVFGFEIPVPPTPA